MEASRLASLFVSEYAVANDRGAICAAVVSVIGYQNLAVLADLSVAKNARVVREKLHATDEFMNRLGALVFWADECGFGHHGVPIHKNASAQRMRKYDPHSAIFIAR